MARELYEKQTWENLPSETTPLSAERLTHIEDGIKSAHDNRALKEIYEDDSINLGRKADTTVATKSTAEGINTTASSAGAHAEGNSTQATAFYAHAEGNETQATGESSHAEGRSTSATEDYAHAEGYGSQALGGSSHAEGKNTYATGDYSHAEGYETKAGVLAVAMAAHAEGYQTISYAPYSHSEGFGTVASDPAQHAGGRYNAQTSGAVVIGCGTSDSDRKNIHTLDWEGNAKFAGTVTDGNGNSISGVKEIAENLEMTPLSNTEILEIINKASTTV